MEGDEDAAPRRRSRSTAPQQQRHRDQRLHYTDSGSDGEGDASATPLSTHRSQASSRPDGVTHRSQASCHPDGVMCRGQERAGALCSCIHSIDRVQENFWAKNFLGSHDQIFAWSGCVNGLLCHCRIITRSSRTTTRMR